MLSDEEFAVISRPGYADHGVIHFDEAMWTPLATRVRRDGSNLLLIDLGEFVVYPSHPELAVKGSWRAERMNAEVLHTVRLKRLNAKAATGSPDVASRAATGGYATIRSSGFMFPGQPKPAGAIVS